jgi:hypothetical protein
MKSFIPISHHVFGNTYILIHHDFGNASSRLKKNLENKPLISGITFNLPYQRGKPQSIWINLRSLRKY